MKPEDLRKVILSVKTAWVLHISLITLIKKNVISCSNELVLVIALVHMYLYETWAWLWLLWTSRHTEEQESPSALTYLSYVNVEEKFSLDKRKHKRNLHSSKGQRSDLSQIDKAL